MANLKLKLKKLPKRPAKNASLAVKERWITRAKEIEQYNAGVIAEAKASEKLDARINGIISSKTTHPTGRLTTVTQKYARATPVRKKKSLSGVKKKKTTSKRKTAKRR
ncbi:MAG TPA: hypothetical protein DCS17_02965 [Flavobacterium sp.]|nr:hypothetical protein [Flavobacterium sp.]